MNSSLIWELIGYAGSALVLVSLLMSSIFKLRVLNAIGSLIFCIYAFKIHSIPTAVMNICLVGIDLYYLVRLMHPEKSDFSAVEVSSGDETVQYMLGRFASDITQYFENASVEGADRVLLVFDNETVAGILAGVSEGDDLRLILDYSTPRYRDCKVAEYLYAKLSGSCKRLIYTGSNEKHIPFCLRMGYRLQDGRYVKEL